MSRVVRVFSWPPVCLRHVRGGVGTDYVSPAVQLPTCTLFGEASCAVLLKGFDSAVRVYTAFRLSFTVLRKKQMGLHKLFILSCTND